LTLILRVDVAVVVILGPRVFTVEYILIKGCVVVRLSIGWNLFKLVIPYIVSLRSIGFTRLGIQTNFDLVHFFVERNFHDNTTLALLAILHNVVELRSHTDRKSPWI
jgi:hypothetical protein